MALIAYTGSLRPKGVPFSPFSGQGFYYKLKYEQGSGNSVFSVSNLKGLTIPFDGCEKAKKIFWLKVVLYGTIRNDDFQRNTASQHCCDIESNSGNVVSTLQRCVSLKIVVANRLVYITSPQVIHSYLKHCIDQAIMSFYRSCL